MSVYVCQRFTVIGITALRASRVCMCVCMCVYVCQRFTVIGITALRASRVCICVCACVPADYSAKLAPTVFILL